MDSDEIDNSIAVELLSNQTDEDLSLQDAERQTTTSAGGCFALVLALVTIVLVLAFSFS